VKPIFPVLLIAAFIPAFAASPALTDYRWLETFNPLDTVAARIAPPPGFEREPAASGSFAEWLRNLPLKKGRPAVLLYNGSLKSNQGAHVAVVDIDAGVKDLQQCADAVIRLRAEYLYSKKDFAGLHFNFTSGDSAEFMKWTQGFRPSVNANRVQWNKTAAPDNSYSSFRAYLNVVFTYAGTASLSQEMRKVADVRDIRAGDVFVEGGFPGHAVIVVDVARDPRSGRRVFLLAQSYMPAQDIHILRNPAGGPTAPWYEAKTTESLKTPEWMFRTEHLRRFAGM
jgi:hypothetical protein